VHTGSAEEAPLASFREVVGARRRTETPRAHGTSQCLFADVGSVACKEWRRKLSSRPGAWWESVNPLMKGE